MRPGWSDCKRGTEPRHNMTQRMIGHDVVQMIARFLENTWEVCGSRCNERRKWRLTGNGGRIPLPRRKMCRIWQSGIGHSPDRWAQLCVPGWLGAVVPCLRTAATASQRSLARTETKKRHRQGNTCWLQKKGANKADRPKYVEKN